ncbi:hypothetical protein WJX77_008902 [Trebouxia sp. C0004]
MQQCKLTCRPPNRREAGQLSVESCQFTITVHAQTAELSSLATQPCEGRNLTHLATTHLCEMGEPGEPVESFPAAEAFNVIQNKLSGIFPQEALQLLATEAIYMLRPRKPKRNTLPGRLVDYGINMQNGAPSAQAFIDFRQQWPVNANELSHWSKERLEQLEISVWKAYKPKHSNVQAERHLQAFLRLSHFVVAHYKTWNTAGKDVSHAKNIVVELKQLKCAELSKFIIAAYDEQASVEYGKAGILTMMKRFTRLIGPSSSQALDDYVCTSLFAEEEQ